MVIVVPDGRDAGRVSAALRVAIGAERFVELTADLGPTERYRRFLRLARGQVQGGGRHPRRGLRAGSGSRPGRHLGRRFRSARRAARSVRQRARCAGPACPPGRTPGRSSAVMYRASRPSSLPAAGWSHLLVAPPRRAAGGGAAGRGRRLRRPAGARSAQARAARLPDLAFAAVRSALDGGSPGARHGAPARLPPGCRLRQLPQRGALPALRRTARPGSSSDVLTCRWCARGAQRPGVSGMRSPATGARSSSATSVPPRNSAGPFPGSRWSAPAAPRWSIASPPSRPWSSRPPEPNRSRTPATARSCCSTPGRCSGRADLRAGEEALRRWMNASALALPAAEGGLVVLVGAAAGLATVQALVRWDPIGFAERGGRLACRTRLPARQPDGGAGRGTTDVDALLAAAELPSDADLLGPVPVTDEIERTLVRVPRAEGAKLAAALQAVTRRAQRQEGAGRSRSAGSGADRLSRSPFVNFASRGRPSHPPVRRSRAAHERAAGHDVRQGAAPARQRPDRHHA